MRAGATAEALDRIEPCSMQRDIVEVPPWITLKSIVFPQKIPLLGTSWCEKISNNLGSSPRIIAVHHIFTQ